MANRSAFIGMLMPAAIEASQRTGIDPRIIVAQAAQETGWGKSAPGNNYFGIKSHGKGGGQNLTTHEVVNGNRVKINDSFRTFASPSDSVAGYADFMTQNKRYRPMLEAQGLDAQLAALGKSGYATDPNYAASVGAIAKSIPLDGNYQPNPYANLPDGPKGEEVYSTPATSGGDTMVAGGGGGILAGAGESSGAIDPSLLKDKNEKSPLAGLFDALAQYPNAQPSRMSQFADARQSGGSLLEALANPNPYTQLARKNRGLLG